MHFLNSSLEILNKKFLHAFALGTKMTAKDLKNALLQEAVQGKLVPQIASEGNARDLLEEIRKEKLSHGLDLRLEASLAINAKSG